MRQGLFPRVRSTTVSVDRGSVLVVAASRAREEVNLIGKDLAAVPLDAVFIFPLGVVEAALNRYQLALLALFANGFGEAIEAGNPVEFAVLGGVAVLIFISFAVLVPRWAVGNHGDASNAGPALGFAGLGIAGDAAGEDNEIGHDKFSFSSQTGNHFRLANVEEKQGMGGLHRRPSGKPVGQGKPVHDGWCGQPAQRATRPERNRLQRLS